MLDPIFGRPVSFFLFDIPFFRAVLEFLGSVLDALIVLTGIAGFGIGYAMTFRQRPVTQRWTVAAALVLLALAGHVLWNSHSFGVFYVLGQFGILAVYLWLIRIGRAWEAGG